MDVLLGSTTVVLVCVPPFAKSCAADPSFCTTDERSACQRIHHTDTKSQAPFVMIRLGALFILLATTVSSRRYPLGSASFSSLRPKQWRCRRQRRCQLLTREADAAMHGSLAYSCSIQQSPMVRTLIKGAFLRVASDLSGGTVFENIKTRTALSSTADGPEHSNPIAIARSIVRQHGWRGLWAGTPSRMVEGTLVGAVFLATSTAVKRQMLQRKLLVSSPTAASLVAGLFGGVAQAVVMTPTSLVFTEVNSSPDTTSSVAAVRRILREKGVRGLYAAGGSALVVRQATNWASRAGITEVMRRVTSGYGVLGELGAGVVGGLGSCWNTPIETIRVVAQSDASQGQPKKSIPVYWKEIVARDGYQGLFRGISPRALQAIWQTTFLVVVPNILGA